MSQLSCCSISSCFLAWTTTSEWSSSSHPQLDDTWEIKEAFVIKKEYIYKSDCTNKWDSHHRVHPLEMSSIAKSTTACDKDIREPVINRMRKQRECECINVFFTLPSSTLCLDKSLPPFLTATSKVLLCSSTIDTLNSKLTKATQQEIVTIVTGLLCYMHLHLNMQTTGIEKPSAMQLNKNNISQKHWQLHHTVHYKVLADLVWRVKRLTSSVQ